MKQLAISKPWSLAHSELDNWTFIRQNVLFFLNFYNHCHAVSFFHILKLKPEVKGELDQGIFLFFFTTQPGHSCREKNPWHRKLNWSGPMCHGCNREIHFGQANKVLMLWNVPMCVLTQTQCRSTSFISSPIPLQRNTHIKTGAMFIEHMTLRLATSAMQCIYIDSMHPCSK